MLAYQQVGTFQVSASGLYTIVDAYNLFGVDVSAVIYVDSFDPSSPATNLVTPDGVDVAEVITLNAGVNYVLVVQVYCGNPDRVWINQQGAWAVTFSGPGDVTSGSVATVPEFTMGTFGAGDPVAFTECGNSQYQESGPIQLAATGTYTYVDISIYYDIDVCVQIYTAPFNPAAPEANRVALVDDEETVELEAGKNYYFVAQPLDESANGDYFYIFGAPAPFDITFGSSGSWYNPDTSGQGFLIDVFDTANLCSWPGLPMTWSVRRREPSLIGDPGHRWLTAMGLTVGDTADLEHHGSSGMIFDSATPPVRTDLMAR